MGAVNGFLGIVIGATAIGLGLKSLDALFLYTGVWLVSRGSQSAAQH